MFDFDSLVLRLTRRGFVRSAAAAAGAMVLGRPAWADVAPPAWTATSNFAPPPGAAPASEKLSGRLSFKTTELEVRTTPADQFIRNPWAWWGIFDFLAKQDPAGSVPLFQLDAKLFPGLELDVVTSSDGDLVPVQRGIVRKPIPERTASFWEIIAGPGKTWAATEADGDFVGWNKAALPFSLVQSQEGEAWLGLAAFYYRGGEVSDLIVQLSSVSAGGFIFWDADWDVTAWGKVGLSYKVGGIDGEDGLLAAYAREVDNRPALRPLSELGEAVAAIGPGVDRKTLLTLAVLKDGTLYHSPIATPFGDYPYPLGMRVGVWSVSKSLIPGMAALRLAQKYGTEFLDSKIVGYFEEGKEFAYVDDAAKARWQQVTIRHALHMATGMGPTDSDANWATDNANTYQWSYSYALADQIRFYFKQGPNPKVTGPGQTLAYIDQDMWIATLAMERFLKQKAGPGATILNMLVDEVYRPIGVDHFAAGTGYTESGEPGLPYSAWGAIPTLDYLAKAGRLIADRGAAEDGTQILHRPMVEDFFANADYQYAFWKESLVSSGKTFHVPKMSGAGGNYVLCMPNGLVGVVLSRDSYNVKWSDQDRLSFVEAGNKLAPF